MAAFQRGVELPYSVPLLGDDSGVEGAIWPAHEAVERTVVSAPVYTVDPLLP